MENQDGYIPEHLRAEWDQTTARLATASENLCDANREYQEAVLARIAISEALKKWQMKTYFNVDFKP